MSSPKGVAELRERIRTLEVALELWQTRYHELALKVVTGLSERGGDD